MTWRDLEDGGRYEVAGYDTFSSNNWHDVEKGAHDPQEIGYELSDLDTVVVHYVNPAGDDIYFTLHGPWDDFDGFEDLIEYALEGYGIET